jgi:phospholipid-binding lipoprotein MlaA
MMHPMLRPFALSAALLLGACAATPGEELGSIPPRSPVTPREQAKVYPIDVWDPFEGFNRGVYRFNTHFDRWIFRWSRATSTSRPTRSSAASPTSSAT